MNISSEVQIALIALVFLIVLVIIFRHRVSEVGFGPAKLTLFKPGELQAATDKAKQVVEAEAKKVPASLKPQWDKVATLFWLGNDLMWTTDMIYRGALPDRVLLGIEHARQYLLDLGFPEGSFPLQQLGLAATILGAIKGLTGSTPEERQLLKQHYTTVTQQIQSIKWFVSALAEQQQPGFEKLRAL